MNCLVPGRTRLTVLLKHNHVPIDCLVPGCHVYVPVWREAMVPAARTGYSKLRFAILHRWIAHCVDLHTYLQEMLHRVWCHVPVRISKFLNYLVKVICYIPLHKHVMFLRYKYFNSTTRNRTYGFYNLCVTSVWNLQKKLNGVLIILESKYSYINTRSVIQTFVWRNLYM